MLLLLPCRAPESDAEFLNPGYLAVPLDDERITQLRIALRAAYHALGVFATAVSPTTTEIVVEAPELQTYELDDEILGFPEKWNRNRQ